MKSKRIMFAVIVGVSIGLVSPGSTQNVADQLNPILERLQDIKSKLDAKAPQKGLRAGGLPSAYQTRAAEDAANEIARTSQEFALSLGGGVNGRAIYGHDDRRNYDQASSSERAAADATAILVKSVNVSFASDGKTFDLASGNVIDRITGRGLCTPAQAEFYKKPEEPFYAEPNPGFCSGFRVSKKHVLTAGHCIESQSDCANTKLVFGFNTTRAHPEKGIASENLYQCKAIVAGALNPDGADWRLVEVDRDITYGSNVTLRTADTVPKLAAGAEVTVVGYPLGLPVKIADGATVRGFGLGFFVANLDTYQGNSGSAVFNKEKLAVGELLVEGVLVRGENDFAMTTPCYLSKRCPNYGCRGEDVTFATEVVAPQP